MHRLFLPIYRFFCRHKALMYAILIVTSAVFIFFGIKVKYEEDISKLLPSSSVESELAFGSIGLKDKIFIQVTSASERLDAATLAEGGSTTYVTGEVIKATCVMFATLPIIILYPFLQRYFVTGIMIGAVKG